MAILYRPSLNDLLHLPVGEVALLPVDILADLQAEADELMRTAKATRERLDGALTLRYGEATSALRNLAGKDTGTVRLEDGPITVVADLPKKVAWDQSLLAGLVERIRTQGDDPAEYVEIAYKVQERKYAAWPGHLRAAFEAARTVVPGKPSFVLTRSDTQ
ncbi:MAG: hypothetical protein EPN20_18195 [Magnetospirillum sp.]|nr:MAG: hypothetical protein EPN20_18195 [Magnetospirillum sp.]